MPPPSRDYRDYSRWLTPKRLEIEEAGWARSQYFLDYARWVSQLCDRKNLRSVLELGCGTGWVGWLLSEDIAYTGVDSNAGCLELARVRAPNRSWVQADIRDLPPFPDVDLVCCFAVLKHFSLSEWPEVLAKVLSHAPYALFTVPIRDMPLEEIVSDSEELAADDPGFIHVTMTRDFVEAAVANAGHEVYQTETTYFEETLFRTARS